MKAIISEISRRITELIAWHNMDPKEREEAARRKNLSALQVQRKRICTLADLRFKDFCRALDAYRSQLQHLQGLDKAHEEYCWDRLRFGLTKGLPHFLNERRPGLQELEAALRVNYRQSIVTGQELEQILDSLRQVGQDIREEDLPAGMAQTMQTMLEQDHRARWRAYEPWKICLARHTQDALALQTGGSTIAKWRAAQNRRRHAHH